MVETTSQNDLDAMRAVTTMDEAKIKALLKNGDVPAIRAIRAAVENGAEVCKDDRVYEDALRALWTLARHVKGSITGQLGCFLRPFLASDALSMPRSTAVCHRFLESMLRPDLVLDGGALPSADICSVGLAEFIGDFYVSFPTPRTCAVGTIVVAISNGAEATVKLLLESLAMQTQKWLWKNRQVGPRVISATTISRMTRLGGMGLDTVAQVKLETKCPKHRIPVQCLPFGASPLGKYFSALETWSKAVLGSPCCQTVRVGDEIGDPLSFMWRRCLEKAGMHVYEKLRQALQKRSAGCSGSGSEELEPPRKRARRAR